MNLIKYALFPFFVQINSSVLQSLEIQTIKFNQITSLYAVCASSCEKEPYRKCGQWRPRSACAKAQADQGQLCPFTKSLEFGEQIDELSRHI